MCLLICLPPINAFVPKVLSILDYFHYSGDATILTEYADKVQSLLTPLVHNWLHGSKPGLGFVGWASEYTPVRPRVGVIGDTVVLPGPS